MVSATFERLPGNVLPKEYNITIKPDLNAFKFNGQVKIECLVTEATSEISFNVADMEISNVTFEANDGGKEIAAENVLMLSKDEKATAKFSSPLPLGKGYLSMDFIGSLNDQMKGLYRSKYVINGEERYAAVSQFEPTDARRAFPCWDEPAIKAVFNITLIVPKDRVALSNMNVISDEVDSSDSNLRIVKFAPSPIMSTYLVAIVVGEYDYIEDTSEDGVLVRVYTPVGKTEQGRFSLQVATKSLPFYKDYFKIGYPLPKLDLIAIADFAAGAMENWGLVTYRETCILIDPNNSSTAAKQRVAIVVAHELAHQWFGNLVTMVCTLYFKEWWTHLWLNEGFATFMEFLCVDNVLPEYNIWTQFVTDMFTVALELDSLKNSHPIEVPVGSPSEIDEIFDTISYNKGASVIRMLHNFIGDKFLVKKVNAALKRQIWMTESSSSRIHFHIQTYLRLRMSMHPQTQIMVVVDLITSIHMIDRNAGTLKITKAHFRDGLHNYLTKFSFGNTLTEDLWDALELCSEQPIGKIMQSWTKQTGFPLISVSAVTKGNERILTISQQKFCSANAEKDNSKWMVPISFSTQADPKTVIKQVVLENDTMEIKFDNIPANHWIKLNPGTIGFYRVQYSSEMLQQFFPSIRDQTLPAVDRLGLQNDLFAMVQTGKVPTTEALKLIEAFSNETDYTVWTSICQCLGTLKVVLSYTESLPLLYNFGRKFFSKIYSHIGWDPKPNESHLDALLRSLVIGRLVSFQDPQVLEVAKKRFQAHIDGTTTISSDLRSAVYIAVVSQGDEKTLNQMIEFHNKTDLQEEKNRISYSLGAVGDESLLEKVLKFAISDDVKYQDSIFVILAVTKSKQGRFMAWNFFKKNIDVFHKRYQGSFLIARLVKGLTEDFASDEMAKEVKEFFQANPFYGTERSVEQAIEFIKINKQWLERDAEAIAAWLQSKQ
ncbi:Puromycin-sensitive aminopeptidase [Nymphon striatum]|nr:Puromycin-sensitive aminopeptidase [Nymphon striatum]